MRHIGSCYLARRLFLACLVKPSLCFPVRGGGKSRISSPIRRMFRKCRRKQPQVLRPPSKVSHVSTTVPKSITDTTKHVMDTSDSMAELIKEMKRHHEKVPPAITSCCNVCTHVGLNPSNLVQHVTPGLGSIAPLNGSTYPCMAVHNSTVHYRQSIVGSDYTFSMVRCLNAILLTEPHPSSNDERCFRNNFGHIYIYIYVRGRHILARHLFRLYLSSRCFTVEPSSVCHVRC